MLIAGVLVVMAATALATPLHSRAGGPIASPIPANCTVINPLPKAGCEVGSVSGWQSDNTFASSNLIYQAYYDSPLSLNDTWTQCSQQCYGYGTPGTCKSVLLAYNVPTPAGWEGTQGGSLSPTACLMFSDYASPDDFEEAPTGEYLNETAGNIYCGF